MRRGDIVTVSGGRHCFGFGCWRMIPNGLSQDSYVMVDKLTTVRRGNTHTVLGRLEAATLVEFERRLLVFLGFGG